MATIRVPVWYGDSWHIRPEYSALKFQGNANLRAGDTLLRTVMQIDLYQTVEQTRVDEPNRYLPMIFSVMCNVDGTFTPENVLQDAGSLPWIWWDSVAWTATNVIDDGGENVESRTTYTTWEGHMSIDTPAQRTLTEVGSQEQMWWRWDSPQAADPDDIGPQARRVFGNVHMRTLWNLTRDVPDTEDNPLVLNKKPTGNSRKTSRRQRFT